MQTKLDFHSSSSLIPHRSRDFYHTCYCLSGLSIAQHFGNKDLHNELILGRDENRLVRDTENSVEPTQIEINVLIITKCSHISSIQAPTHPVYNICPEKVAQAIEHFHRLPVPVQTGPTPSAMDQS